MSTQILGQAWKVQCSPTRKLILVALADHANDEDFQCWPSLTHLEKKTGFKRRTLTRTLADLEAEGFLSRHPNERTGTTMYTLNVSAWTSLIGRDTQSLGTHSPQSRDTQSLQLGTHSPSEPSIEPSGNRQSGVNGKGGHLADRFEEWWQHYPKKRGKEPSRKKWRQKRLDERADELIADVQKRKAQDARWLQGFPPDPQTYLNQERWEDEIEPPQQQSAQGQDPFQGAL